MINKFRARVQLQRRRELYDLHMAGWSFAELAKEYKISRRRILQIFAEAARLAEKGKLTWS